MYTNTHTHLGFEVLEHPAYSPDFALSDCHFFGPFKKALRGRRFCTDKEVRKAVNKWLRDQPKTSFEGNTQACGPMDQMHRKGRRLCRKTYSGLHLHK